jgi:hypothetical protein
VQPLEASRNRTQEEDSLMLSKAQEISLNRAIAAVYKVSMCYMLLILCVLVDSMCL